MADPIETWLQQLDEVLASQRRLRSTRIVEEVGEHLRASAEDFERRGLSRREAESAAVERIGPPGTFAQGFRRPTGRHWLTETIAWVWSRAATTLMALGILMLLVEIVVWSFGTGPLTGHAVRIWQMCKEQSIDGQCIGGWRYTYASVLDVFGGLLLLVGLAGVAVYKVFRRYRSDLELVPKQMDRASHALLALLGIALLIGGATRSSLDGSWRWVPVWLLGGLLSLVVAGLLHQDDLRKHRTDTASPFRMLRPSRS